MIDNKDVISVNAEQTQSWEESFCDECLYAPLVDIYEIEEDFVLVANMPGVKKENIRTKIEDRSLVIFGRMDIETLSHKKYILNETEIGNYYRKFNLSENIDESKIAGKFENGQLILHLPKHERAKPRTIEIK
jgi:HSP20 family molecular chaperone IbpA